MNYTTGAQDTMLRIKTVNVIARECNFELTTFQYKLLIEVQHEINSMYEYDELETLSAINFEGKSL